MPAVPQKPAGLRIEPPVSEPMAPMQSAAATAAPEPLDEPPGWYSVFHGLRTGRERLVGRHRAVGEFVRAELAQDDRAAPPSGAARSRRRSPARSPARRCEWPVVRTPAVS